MLKELPVEPNGCNSGELTDEFDYGKISKKIKETELLTLATKDSKSKSNGEVLGEVRSFTKELKD